MSRVNFFFFPFALIWGSSSKKASWKLSSLGPILFFIGTNYGVVELIGLVRKIFNGGGSKHITNFIFKISMTEYSSSSTPER